MNTGLLCLKPKAPGSGWLDSGNQITLTATANTGYTFAGFRHEVEDTNCPFTYHPLK